MTPERQQLLETLAEISNTNSDQRFGQLIANLSFVAREPTNAAIWDVEDDELLEAARDYLKHKRQNSSAPVESLHE
jgi:hypothetical protein